MSSPKTAKPPTGEIIEALERAGSVRKAAKLLGVAKSTFFDWISELNIKKKTRLSSPGVQTPIVNNEKSIFIVTCAINNTAINEPFLASLRQYCQHRGAKLLVIPIRYKNVSAYLAKQDGATWWARELRDDIHLDSFEVNGLLTIMGNSFIQATAASPLAGLDILDPQRSFVIGHPTIETKTAARPVGDNPRIFMTTGAVTESRYSESVAGMKATARHACGAVVVERDGEDFWLRNIEADPHGGFYDLDSYYSPDGTTGQHRLKALSCGDTHLDFIDPGVKAATWGAGSITEVLNPEHEFHHDVLDFFSANHHHRGDVHLNFAKHHWGLNSVDDELTRLVDFFSDCLNRPDTIYHIVPSNHNDALQRWLKEADIRQDPENALIYHELNLQVLQGITCRGMEISIPHPLKLYMESRIRNPESVIFHDRSEKVEILGVDFNQHFDKGVNGSRGSLAGMAKTGRAASGGHGHGPGKKNRAIQAGTSSQYNLGYNMGYSTWAKAHVGMYPSGATTIFFISGNRWRG